MIAVDWTTVTVSGAFVIGISVGCVLTIRLLRIAADAIRRERDHAPYDGPPEGGSGPAT